MSLFPQEISMDNRTVVSVHWSFWLIGAIGLVFNLMGCLNFLSQMDPDRVASMPEAYRAIIEDRPVWATGAFSIAVFGGALGGILLLLRRSAAYVVLIASLAGAVVAQIPFLGMAGFPVEALVGGLTQLIGGAFLVWYAKWAQRKDWIR
jgi:hypothetical protein